MPSIAAKTAYLWRNERPGRQRCHIRWKRNGRRRWGNALCRNSRTREKAIVLAIIGPRWVMMREGRKLCGGRP